MPPIYEGSVLVSKMCVGAAIVAAAYCGTQSAISGGAFTAPALAPTLVSQPLVAAYSLRKVVPVYAGNCIKIRNSLNAELDIGFDGNGNVDVAAIAAFAALGDGNVRLSRWYDQSGGANTASAVQYPRIVLGAVTASTYSMPAVDFGILPGGAPLNQALYTATSPLNVGGARNLAACVVMNTMGWGKTGGTSFDRAPAVFGSTAHALGYGASTGVLLKSAGPYSLGYYCGDTSFYGLDGDLAVDSEPQDFLSAGSTVGTFPRMRAVAFNQQGASCSAFSDSRRLFSGRAHGVADAAAQRLVIGNRGIMDFAHNGQIFEILIYNPAAAPVSDTEILGVSKWQQQFWTMTAAARYATRYWIWAGGQSNMLQHGNDLLSGDGTAGSASQTAVLNPVLKTLLGGDTDNTVDVFWNCNITPVGGSVVIRESLNNVGLTTYWWDNALNAGAGGPGPLLTSLISQIKAKAGWATWTRALSWAQGETDDTGIMNGYSGCTIEVWKANTLAVWAYIRGQLGMPNLPILVQPIAGYYTRMNQAQKELVAAAGPNVYMTNSLTDVQLGSGVHYALYPSLFGYRRVADRDARALAANVFGVNVNWQGPTITSAVKSGANTVDVTLTYPVETNATDFTPTTGIEGFSVTDGSGARTIASAARLSATSIRITVSGAAISGATTVIYQPAGVTAPIDPTAKYVTDNSTPCKFSLEPCYGIAAA